MLRFKRPELIMAFMVGVAFFALLETLLGYQAANCSYQQEYKAKASPSDSHASSSNKGNDGGDEHGHKTISEPFVCGVAGIPTAARQFMNRNEGFFVAGFTLALVVVTGWLVSATLKLYEAGERQLITSRSVAAVQARNTRRQLKIAEGERNDSRDVFVATQRPWVSVDKIIPVGKVDFDPTLRLPVEITLINGGPTPAVNVNWEWSYWASYMRESPEEMQASFAASLVEKRKDTIAKNGGFLLTPGAPFKTKMLTIGDLLPEGQKFRVYIVGCVDYRFPGADTYHQTGFMYVLARQQTDDSNANFGQGRRQFAKGQLYFPEQVLFEPNSSGFFAT